MNAIWEKSLLLVLLTVASVGCDSRPAANPDGGTTVIEERDVEVDTDPAMPPPESGTDVNIDIGGGKGVDVEVNRDDANAN